MSVSTPLSPPARAVWWRRCQDDLQGLVTGTLFAALGILLFQHAGLVPGGTVGLALLLHYASGLPLGWAMFIVNLPFYALAWLRLGPVFTGKTLLAVSMLALQSWWLPLGLDVQHVAGPLAAVLGGLLCGAGMLMLFRHQASLGGLNVLVLYAHDRLGWGVGRLQMALDAVIVLGGGWWMGTPQTLALSVLAVVTVNLALVFNHRAERTTPA